MWKKKSTYQHAIADEHSNDFVFSNEDDSADLQGGPVGEDLGVSHTSFLRSITSLGRASHESSRRSQSQTRGRTSGVFGASHSHVEKALANNSRRESPESKQHGRSAQSTRGHVDESDGLGDDADWDADISGSSLPKPKAERLEPALMHAIEKDEKKEEEDVDVDAKDECDPEYPFLRKDWQERLADPFSALTHQTPSDADATKYTKIVRALVKQPFEIAELKKQSWSGIPEPLRALVWQVLVGYLPVNSGTRASVLARKRKEYVKGITQLFQGEKEPALWHQIIIDVPRTNPGIPLYSKDATHRSLERILYLWAMRHPASGYVQGINDLVTPFFHVFLQSYLANTDVGEFDPKDLPKEVLNAVEADTYWCLTKVLDTIQDNYIHEQPGIIRQITELQDLVTRDEPALAEHFKDEGLDFIQFSFRWMNCMLMREFDLPLVIRMWDTYLSNSPTGFSTFHVYVCCAFLRRFSEELLGMEFQDIIMFLQDSAKTKNWTEEDIEMMLSEAFVWQSLYENATAHLK